MTKGQPERAGDVVIRPLGPDAASFESAARLHHRCFIDGWSADTLKDLCTVVGTIAITAQSANRTATATPIGLAIMRTVLDQADLLTIGVDPDHRHKGLGRLLLQNAEASARALGARTLFLEVSQDNTAANALYRDAGYIVTGKRRNYYRTEVGCGTALIMKKALTV